MNKTLPVRQVFGRERSTWEDTVRYVSNGSQPSLQTCPLADSLPQSLHLLNGGTDWLRALEAVSHWALSVFAL